MKFSDFFDLAKKYPNERVQIFIDGPNFYGSLESQCDNHKLNYGKFATKITSGRKLVRINYYISKNPPITLSGSRKRKIGERN